MNKCFTKGSVVIFILIGAFETVHAQVELNAEDLRSAATPRPISPAKLENQKNRAWTELKLAQSNLDELNKKLATATENQKKLLKSFDEQKDNASKSKLWNAGVDNATWLQNVEEAKVQATEAVRQAQLVVNSITTMETKAQDKKRLNDAYAAKMKKIAQNPEAAGMTMSILSVKTSLAQLEGGMLAFETQFDNQRIRLYIEQKMNRLLNSNAFCGVIANRCDSSGKQKDVDLNRDNGLQSEVFPNTSKENQINKNLLESGAAKSQ